jgi:hypothetical protein
MVEQVGWFLVREFLVRGFLIGAAKVGLGCGNFVLRGIARILLSFIFSKINPCPLLHGNGHGLI